jgi:hypothetical protein
LPELVKNHMQKPGVLDELLQQKLPPGLNTPIARRAFGDFIVAQSTIVRTAMFGT